MKILVYGAGAVGAALGGFLQRAGHETTLLGRKDRLCKDRTSFDSVPLRITGILGDFTTQVRVAESLDSVDNPDLVLLTVKAYDTFSAADALHAFDDGHMRILHIQNGIGNYEILKKQIDSRRIFTGMIITGFEIKKSAEVCISVVGGDAVIGRIGAPVDEEVRELVALFKDTPLKFTASNFAERTLWKKLLYNAALNPLSAILQVPYGKLKSSQTLDIIQEILREAFDVADAEQILLPWSNSQQYFDHLCSIQIPATAGHRSSMLYDLGRGGQTEIEFLNGAVVRLAKQHGLAVPVNAALSNQIRFMEKQGK